MSYIFLILSVFLSASYTVIGKYYNKKYALGGNLVSIYNVLFTAVVFVCWCVLYALNFSFDVRVLPYSVLFALLYVMSLWGSISALKYGSATLTKLLVSFALMLTTVWGFIFWNSVINMRVTVGLILVALSIVLCLSEGKKGEKRISVKWFLFAVLATLCSAGCSIVQKTEQMDFNGKHGEMLMTFATFLSFVVFSAVYLFKDRKHTEIFLKRTWYLPVCAGVCNVALNMFIIILATSELSPSLIYPTVGVGSLIAVILFSFAVFKERLRFLQYLGIAAAIVAIILLL